MHDHRQQQEVHTPLWPYNNEVPKLASILCYYPLVQLLKIWPNSKPQHKPGIMPKATSVYIGLPMVTSAVQEPETRTF